MDSFAKLVHQNDVHEGGYVHKYLRRLILNHFGSETLKNKLLYKFEDAINHGLHEWTKQPEVDARGQIADVSNSGKPTGFIKEYYFTSYKNRYMVKLYTRLVHGAWHDSSRILDRIEYIICLNIGYIFLFFFFFCICMQMIFGVTSKILMSYEPEKSKENLAENFSNILGGLMKFPLYIPGTAFYRCIKVNHLIEKLSSINPANNLLIEYFPCQIN